MANCVDCPFADKAKCKLSLKCEEPKTESDSYISMPVLFVLIGLIMFLVQFKDSKTARPPKPAPVSMINTVQNV